VNNTYDPAAIEARWQAHWKENRTFRTPNPGDADFDPSKPKYFVLDMFPYPSGDGLHVGHPMGYIGSDIVARKMRMQGHNVLHPMGYDAFGLPAEQYAIQTGQHPSDTTAKNTATFRKQMELVGLSYDWDRELTTSEPRYYRWTQWIFARLFDRGLAYQTEVPVWWCEELRTVLANEEVINGRSERGDHPCIKRPLKQWMLKITAYAERLLDDLDLVDWPESVKTMQREWIGRSEGAEVSFPIEGHQDASLKIFTTRPDTIFGATFMVVAPEHGLVSTITTEEQREAVAAYKADAASKSDLERTDLAKGKSGVFTGAYCRNPVFEESDPRSRVQIWVADYVLASYGTGAIMAVPGQDERDWEFAETYDLPIVRTVEPEEGFDGKAYAGAGRAINSGFLNDLDIPDAKAKIIIWLGEKGLGEGKTTYRLRDWLFSRQRYWGEPFPVLHSQDGSTQRVRDEDLPVELPDMVDFAPPADGSPPLSKATDWVSTTDPVTGAPVMRDTDTMPGWAGSCWYYLRFMDPDCETAPLSKEAESYWQNVDLYIGGTEHAVLHLLYARFWHKVLFDEGVVSTKEPFQRLFNQGMLTAFAFKDASGRTVPVDEVDEEAEGGPRLNSTGELVERITAKMSKTLKNVINPNDVCAEYGVDTFRLYEMFMGPLSDSKPWNPRDVPGCRRFLERLWRLLVDREGSDALRPNLLTATDAALEGDSLEVERSLNRALKRIEDSFKHFNFNTAIAALMTFVGEVNDKADSIRRDQAERLVCVLAPFAPHVCEELWSRLGHDGSVCYAAWPQLREEFLVSDEFELVVQVLGKVRAKVKAPSDATKEQLEALALEAVSKWTEGKQVVKAIVVPGRLVNLVVR
jgi:leucyl-tRNA synthetase